jgi:Cu/Ag efflux protein CusF
MRSPSLKLAAVLVASALCGAAYAQPKAETSFTSQPGKGTATATISASALVEAIDQKTRKVTLKLPQGSRTFTASDEVRNLDKIKAGDTVQVMYMESVTLELMKDGKSVVGRTEAAVAGRAAPGSSPGGIALREVTAVADVMNVDAAKKIVTVKNAQGEMVDLPIQDPEQIKLVKKGDQVKTTYREALAVGIEPAKAAAPAAPAPKK